MNSIKDILLNLGYSNIIDTAKDYRMRPIYRDSDNNTVLSVKKDSGRFIDFSRGVTGSLEELIKISLNLSSVEDAKKWMSSRSIEIEKNEEEKPKISAPKIFDKNILLKLKKDHSYWINRGIREDVLIEFEGGVALSGKMINRYTFPIFNSVNQIVGFSGRDLITSSLRPKWKHIGQKNQWCFPAKLTLKHIKESGEVILVESIGDCLSLYNAGVKNVLVTFGLEVSNSIVNLLLRLDVKTIRICFNDDSESNSAGNAACKKAYAKLNKFFDRNQLSINLPSKNDFGEMTEEEILQWKKKI